jgi:chromosome segregation ATPase
MSVWTYCNSCGEEYELPFHKCSKGEVMDDKTPYEIKHCFLVNDRLREELAKLWKKYNSREQQAWDYLDRAGRAERELADVKVENGNLEELVATWKTHAEMRKESYQAIKEQHNELLGLVEKFQQDLEWEVWEQLKAFIKKAKGE